MALHGDPIDDVGSAAASSSSIALLQERFRQLQKMRERREEMKLLKLFTDQSETTSPTKYYEQSRNTSVQPEVMYHKPGVTARPYFQDTLTLGLDLYGNKIDHKPSKTPPFRDFWSMDSVSVSTSRAYDKPDVDTSLHL